MWKTWNTVFFVLFFVLTAKADFTVEKSVFIKAKPHHVMDYMMDIGCLPYWIEGFIAFRHVKGIPQTPGAESLQIVENSGFRFEFRHVVTAIDFPRKLSFSLYEDRMNIHSEYLFKKHPEGTLLQIRHHVELNTFLWRRLKLMVERSYTAASTRNLETLKAQIEGRVF